ncbi:MAG: P-loop NTPase fold protein, partial [Cyclobacteriaceae bacterium]
MKESTAHSEFPRFIDNKPSGEDQLDGKSHDRISSNISQIIKDEKYANKLIGLDGSWGSGKSNVIEIIKNKLQTSHYLFNYDAWGHQEDLKRRSFLEELIEDLCKLNLINSIRWRENLKDLLSKKRETVSKTVPTLSNGIIVVVLITILYPITSVIAEDLINPWKIIVTSIPIAIALISYLLFSIKERRLLRFTDIFYLYRQKELENTTHVTISEKEPSVREFQDWIGRLSNDLKKKKLIVVFDNMDRLPPEKVKELWSSIHTFFSEESFPNIWVIVPFDRKHIQEAFNNEKDKSTHFINKTFSIIFRVTPPVLSDWKAFFGLKFKEAFGNTTDYDYEIVRNLFDVL